MDVSLSQHGEEELTWDKASSRDKWCFHVRHVFPMHWSGEPWLVESGQMDNHSRGGLLGIRPKSHID